jgi:transposase-like protein
MKKVLQIRGKGKVRKARAVEVMNLEGYGAMEVDSRLELIHELIPIGLMHVKDELQREVRQLAGDKYQRNGLPDHDRWGSQLGSIYIQDQRIPILVQRVRDTKNNREVSLRTYEGLQSPSANADEKVLKRILHGLSCRNYRECSEAIPEALSLSASTVSRRYIRASERKLKELMERNLGRYDFIAVVIDGKSFGEDGIIMAVGITTEGKKVLLGMIQSGTENHIVCRDFLRKLIARGLRYEQGLLCVIDGAKGFRKAVTEVFGVHGIVQRCQWHKRENIVEYLPKKIQKEFRKKLQTAYEEENYAEAKAALLAIKKELRLINESAASSMEEGFEETLTVHRLGVPKGLRKTLKTTNVIESVLALVSQKTGKIDYWKNSDQKQRWVATALLDIEGRLNRVNGYRHLKSLRIALQREIMQVKGKEAVAA